MIIYNTALSLLLPPIDYDIHLTVDLADFTVMGQSVTNLNIVEETSYIIIHVNCMNITQHSIKQNGANVAVKSNFTYKENDFYVIRLEKSLSIGKAELDMTFDYTLGEDLSGFYRSSYKDKSGDTHWLATTQFEATDARKAFPCFDEPALKANFTISVTHDKDLNVHSNMPIERLDPISDTTIKTSFETSVKMSTYLVAFVVSEFECMTTQTRTEKPVNVSSGSSGKSFVLLLIPSVHPSLPLSHSLTHSLTHYLIPSLHPSLSPPCTHSFTSSLLPSHSLTHSLTHSLSHSFPSPFPLSFTYPIYSDIL